MIEIKETEIYGWEAAIRGMRNPMESWGKSDSYHVRDEDSLLVGDADLALMVRLANAGPDHGKFLRMITVTADILAPRYWWAEYDTYKVGTVANSCSTMHGIHKKEFTRNDFSHEHLDVCALEHLDNTIALLNRYRDLYNDGFKGVPGDDVLDFQPHDKTFWWQMIQLLPSSYNQRRTVQLNYAVLRNMYKQRKDHKLDCWRDFCRWAESLPYAAGLITPAEGARERG